MKLSNIFKKGSSRNSNSKNVNVQKLEKSQLEKVIGGTEGGPLKGIDLTVERAVSTPGVK